MVDVPESFKAAAGAGFVVDVDTGGDGVVVWVRGELDVLTAPLLWQRLEEAIFSARAPFVVDLARTSFIDSMGLGTLIRAHKRLADLGMPLVLRAPTDQARTVLRVTGLDQVLEIR